MSNIINLVKVMLKGESDLSITNAKDKKMKSIMKIILVLVLIGFAGASFSLNIVQLYEPLKSIGQQNSLITLILVLSSMMILFFSFIYIISSFYFSKDIDRLIYLPVTADEILSAKFISNYVYQLSTALVISLPMFIAFGILDKQNWLFYLKAILTLFLIPIVPMCISAVLVMILMRFSRLFRNKDTFNVITGIISVILAMSINFIMQSGNKPGAPIGSDSSLLKADKLAYKIISPSIAFIGDKITKNLSVFLVGFFIVVLISIIAYGIFYFVGSKLYLDGVQGVSESASKRQVLTTSKLNNMSKSKTSLATLISKEIKTLLRTPAYLLNLILPQFIVLIFSFGYAIFMFFKYSKNINLSDVINGIGTIDLPLILLISACITIFFAAISPITGTAFTREGSNFEYLKYLPVEGKTIINSKFLTALYFTLPLILLIYIPALILFKKSISYLLIGLVTGLLSIISIFSISLLIDAKNPKLDWENETKAVKQGLNGFLQFLIVLLFIALLVGLTYLFPVDSTTYIAIILVSLVIVAIVSYTALIKFGINAIYNKD